MYVVHVHVDTCYCKLVAHGITVGAGGGGGEGGRGDVGG